MAPPQSAQKQMPVTRVGPLTTRAGVTFGLRARRCACTASNVACSMSGDTATVRISLVALSVLFLALVELMAADIGRSRQDAMNLPNAPTPATAGEDAAPRLR